MARQLKEGVGTVWVRPEKGGIEMVSFAEGDDIPDWAAKQMGDHLFDDGDNDDDIEVPYAKRKNEELEELIAERNEGRADEDQIVPDSNKKADLVAALETDDAANAE